MSRIITAVIFLPILIFSILIPGLWPVFVALAGAAMILALWEFWLLAKKAGIKPDAVVGFAGAAAIFTIFFYHELGFLLLALPLLVIAALTSEVVKGSPFDKMLLSSAATVLGVLYIVFLGGHLVALRMATGPPLQAYSADLLLFFFMVIMGSDIGAYYIGKAVGRRKLAPSISPGKTWEGFAGGLLASLLFAVIARFWFFQELSLPVALVLAAAMNLLGAAGDLTESALKRGAGIKDTANILPGHGGFLDRLDSLLFNAPVIYYFGQFYFDWFRSG